MTFPISRRQFMAASGSAGVLGAAVNVSEVSAEDIPVTEKEKGLVFLFQGDSITDGNWGRNIKDLNHILGHGYVFAVGSRLAADFPNAGFVFHNRGISGHKVTDLEDRWEKDTLALKPNVLSVLVGVNDAGANIHNRKGKYDTATFEERYRGLLRQCKEANPQILFVLGVPFIYRIAGQAAVWEAWERWERELPPLAEAVKKLAKEFDAVLVDYPAMFERAAKSAPLNHWTWDGCHPTIAGHELMAREWIKHVSVRLPFLKKYNYN
ncbi:MAG: SGNH/GDSL hydrolase family protein [Planctomycetaceae bacterium]|nr:SGNH/GDSL hydrolase family protein [Planctomycetaceae bacterium]